MKPPAEGSKAFQLRKFRERRAVLQSDPVKFAAEVAERKAQPYQRKVIKHLTEAIASKPINAPVQASAPATETNVKKPIKKKAAKLAGKKRGRSEAAANLKAAKEPKTSKPKAAKTTVPAIKVAAFICRDGGASMAELVEEFGIEAHPMRAKIHYVRHKLGYGVNTRDGRYYGVAPTKAA